MVVEAVVDMDVGEDPGLAMLDDPLVLDVIDQAVLVESGGQECEAVTEDMDVDV